MTEQNSDDSSGPPRTLSEHLHRMTSQLDRVEDLLREMDELPQEDWPARRDAFLSELATA